MTVHVRDLKNQTGEPGPHAVLHCCLCGEDNSANKSDYFMLPDDHVFMCCDAEMQLAVKKEVYELVTPEKKPLDAHTGEEIAKFIEAHSCVASCCDAQPSAGEAKALADCVRGFVQRRT